MQRHPIPVCKAGRTPRPFAKPQRKKTDAPSAAALRLAQKNRLAELETQAEEARDRLADALEALARAGEAIRHAESGVSTAREVARLAAELDVDMPISLAVAAVLDGRCTASEAVELLMARDPRVEAF